MPRPGGGDARIGVDAREHRRERRPRVCERLSRAAVAVSSVLNFGKLLRLVDDQYRGRVFATLETLTWSMMMLSMFGAGWASDTYSPRAIGVVSGLLSSTTSVFWVWANMTGRLPQPESEPGDDDIEVHGDPNV